MSSYNLFVHRLCLTRTRTHTAEGIVRLYRNYDTVMDQGPVQMVSAFRAQPELIPVKQGSGMVTDWRQAGGLLIVGGDSRTIRVWEAHTEEALSVRRIRLLWTVSDCYYTGL